MPLSDHDQNRLELDLVGVDLVRRSRARLACNLWPLEESKLQEDGVEPVPQRWFYTPATSSINVRWIQRFGAGAVPIILLVSPGIRPSKLSTLLLGVSGLAGWKGKEAVQVCWRRAA